MHSLKLFIIVHFCNLPLTVNSRCRYCQFSKFVQNVNEGRNSAAN